MRTRHFLYGALAGLLWWPVVLSSAPPTVDAELKTPVGKPTVLYVGGIKDDDSFGFAEGWADPGDCTFFEGVLRGGRKQFLVVVNKPGKYVVTFWTKGEVEKSRVVLGDVDSPADPPKTVPTPAPPPWPGGFYFLVVRADGPRPNSFDQTMSLPGWAELEKRGHRVKDKTVSEAAALGVDIPAGTELPCVVTLRVDVVGGKSKVARGPVPVPPHDLIVKLPDEVK